MNRLIDRDPSEIIIMAPNRVIFKIFETVTRVREPFSYPPKTMDFCRIKILGGELHYNHGGNNDATVYTSKNENVWLGKKWIDRRMREHASRESKKLLPKKKKPSKVQPRKGDLSLLKPIGHPEHQRHKEMVRFTTDGKIYINGRLASVFPELTRAMLEWENISNSFRLVK